MTWNHRVIYHPAEGEWGESWFGIHECFYEDDDKKIPTGWTMEAVGIVGEDLEGLSKTLNRMGVALSKPVLEVDGEKLKEWKPE